MLIARLVHSFQLQVAGRPTQGWYVQIFDTEKPTPRYSKKELQQIEGEGGGPLHPDDLYARPLFFEDAYTDRAMTQRALHNLYPRANLVNWGYFEQIIEATLAALARQEREQKVAQGWTPFDTSYACRLCGGKIYWDHNPEFQHGNTPWGQIVYTWAHCIACKTTYGQSYEVGLTYLNSKEPIPPSWFYLHEGKSYTFEPRKREDYIW